MSRLATDSTGAETIKTEARIGVLGCMGRVAHLVIKEIESRHWGPNVTLAGGTVKPGYPAPLDFYTTEDPDDLFKRSDVVIDFTKADATAKHIWLAGKHHKPYVIGTTGLNAAQEQEIMDTASEASVVYAPNMSIGINMLLALVEQAAAKLGPRWDIEIAETHHKHKIDAPSGTALALGKAAASGRKIEFDPVFNREGERQTGAIGFSVQRGGDIVGEHNVTFFAEGERLELNHKASNRSLFAKGAIRAALWVQKQPYGLYSMRDVLEL